MAYSSMKCCELYSTQMLHDFTGEQFAELLRNVHATKHKGLVMLTVCSSESGFSIQTERIVT